MAILMLSQLEIELGITVIEEGGDDLGRVEAPTLEAVQVEAVTAFGFDPEDFAGFGSEGGAVGPGTAVGVTGCQVEAEGGFADARLSGEDGNEAGWQPAGPVPPNGNMVWNQVGPIGAIRWIIDKFGAELLCLLGVHLYFYEDPGGL